MRQLVRYHKMDPLTRKNLVREDLGIESHVVIQLLLLTPKCPRNKEREVPKTPQQAECQPASSSLDFFQRKYLHGVDMAVNRRNICYLMDLWPMWAPASASLPNLRLL
jgi:hypothetical protein